jgi:hypothetical protein
MNVSMRYSTFLPMLLEAMDRTNGDVLEIGAGVFSTPILHWLCEKQKRNLFTMESDWKWYYFVCQYFRTDHHKFVYAKKWQYDESLIKKEWDVVLIDHSPSERRVEEIKKLANLAKYLVVHDAGSWKDNIYHYSTIYPLFKYRFDFDIIDYPTVVLSNFHDLKDFGKDYGL